MLLRLSYKNPHGSHHCHNEYWKWHYAAPPRRVMGPAGTVDGTIGRFLLPIGGGALLRLLGQGMSNPLKRAKYPNIYSSK